MTYDTTYRHDQALDPSALTIVVAALHALDTAVRDCRAAGKDPGTDAAVLLLARHLGSIVVEAEPDPQALRRRCTNDIAAIRQAPALRVLAHRETIHDARDRMIFHAEGRRALVRLADALGLAEGCYDIRLHRNDEPALDEVVLHGETIFVRLAPRIGAPGLAVTFRRVRGRSDTVGACNHVASIEDLLAPERLARRIRRELGSVPQNGPVLRAA